jgi:glycosyltransferase involved in cell wall biosynthesis
MKGVFTLPAIDRLLHDAAVPVTWTIVGSGPASADLHHAWRSAANVSWIDAATPAMVRALCARHDVFVLPTRAEGLSVATVEAMSAGLVPVVSDLPAMAELAAGGSAALRIPVGDARGFADAIIQLSTDRERLHAMGVAARQIAVERFDIRSRVTAYQDLFARCRDLYRPRPAAPACAFGSRLDQPWMPNSVVRLVRSALRRARTRAA